MNAETVHALRIQTTAPFAEATGGHLTAASTLGAGTTFTVTLPQTPDMAQPSGHDLIPVQLTVPDVPAGTATRVLYIEDNPADIDVVARFLKTRPGVIAYLDLTEPGQLLDSFAAGHDHKAHPALRTVPAP